MFTCPGMLFLNRLPAITISSDFMEDQSTVDPEAGKSSSESMTPIDPNNEKQNMLKRKETVPDIKRDTSGITTQYVATGIVNLGAFAAGVCVSWSSSALPLLEVSQHTFADMGVIDEAPSNFSTSTHPRLEITESEASWVASLLCLGAFLGAVPAGLISEYFGRKKTLLYLALPLVVSWILVASSPNVYGLYVGRIVAGIAVGAFSVSIPPYVADIAETSMQPTLAHFYHVQFTCGILFGYIIGLVQNTSWISVLCACLPVAFFIAFLFVPESPAYLISQGKADEAKAALTYFRGIDNDVDEEITVLKDYMKNSRKNKATFGLLFVSRGTVRALIVSFGLMMFQQLSGIYPVLFYAEVIFKSFAIYMSAPGAAIILGFFLVSSTYFSTMLLNKIGRRVLLIFSFTVMALNAGALAIYYHMRAANLNEYPNTWFPLLTLCIYVSAYASGVGPIPWLMLREIFPPYLTRRASAITAGFHWFLAFGVTKLYQNMVDLVKPGWTLWNFAVSCVMGAIFVYFFVPETKDTSLEDIQKEFNGIRRKKLHTHVIRVEGVLNTSTR